VYIKSYTIVIKRVLDNNPKTVLSEQHFMAANIRCQKNFC